MSPARYEYIISHEFAKKWKRFNPITQKLIADKIDIFLQDPHNPQLKTHKLSGKLKSFWAFSLKPNLRIMFRFTDKAKVVFIDIATNGIYR